jgi:hypothetical protein
MLPLLTENAAFVGTILLDLLDQVKVIIICLENEPFADQLRCNDFLFIIQFCLCLIEDELTSFFCFLEFFLNSDSIFGFVLLFLAIPC